MTNTVRALVIEPGTPGEVREVRADLPGMQAMIGGYLEAITGDTWHLYCDEDGNMRELAINPVATALARLLLLRGQNRTLLGNLLGTVVFLGQDGGKEADVPLDVLIYHKQLTEAKGNER